MQNKTWTYLANGRRYRISLLHSPKKGYVVIYCGTRLIQIDFQVFTDTKYSFFIEDDLCHIHIQEQAGTLYYHFEIDNHADTGANRRRRSQFRKDLITSLLVFTGAITVFVLGALLFTSYQRYRQSIELTAALAQSGTLVPSYILNYSPPDGPLYQYRIGGKVYIEEVPNHLLGGLPLNHGEEYAVYCAADNPRKHLLRLDQPSESLRDKLFLRTLAAHRNAHPERAEDQLKCEVEQTFRSFGWKGLSHLYRQTVPPALNESFNRITYQKFIYSQPYQAKVDTVCNTH